MPTANTVTQKGFLAQWKPYLIVGAVTLAVGAEVSLIAYLFEAEDRGPRRTTFSLPKADSRTSSSSEGNPDQRAEDTANMKDNASIQGNVLNPVESAFSDQAQLDQAQKVGLQ